MTTTLAIACADRVTARDELAGVQSVSTIRGTLHSGLVENSIAVTSVTQPGIIFGLNDSGHDPEVFAFDSAARPRGRWLVSGARNRDWEAAAIGPCGSGAGHCLYVGDVGDNDARHRTVFVFRFPEPVANAATGNTVAAERLEVRYPDRAHDVEAMYVSADGAVHLITKRRLRDGAGRLRPALIYRIPATDWRANGVVTATLVDSLPIIPGAPNGRFVSDAALSPDGRRLAVRTYLEVYVFAVDSITGRPRSGVAPTTCAIVGLNEPQGEGIGWWWDRRRLLLTSEGRNAPLHVIECPLPSAR
jgi:hypothetical protein